ncbi:hypothetical protein [Pantoea ananatis]|uniref:hypothetical protein n=1 Tax=Pantoea ananas TaxID=553 RepID=UPI001B316AD8|nr:hypothetical protein [Pantoea ananatis]
MEISDLKPGMRIKTLPACNLPRYLHGEWIVKDAENLSFSLHRIESEYIEYFSPVALKNFVSDE